MFWSLFAGCDVKNAVLNAAISFCVLSAFVCDHLNVDLCCLQLLLAVGPFRYRTNAALTSPPSRRAKAPLRRDGGRLRVELRGLVVGPSPVPLVALPFQSVVDVALRHTFLKVRVRVRQVALEAAEVARPGAALLVEGAPRLHLCQNQPVRCSSRDNVASMARGA